jgi:cytochrome c oxidase cbb3-type subunit 4
MTFGLITLLLMLLFVGITVWAWSSRRRKTYDKAARMPLEEDPPKPPGERPS